MFSRKKFFIYLLAYFIIRTFVWFFPPATPLYAGSIINTVAATLIAVLCAYLIYTNDMRGWLIIAAEIIFCGSGNMLSVGSVSLRTILLIISLSIYFGKKLFFLQQKKYCCHPERSEGSLVTKTSRDSSVSASWRIPQNDKIIILSLIVWAGVSAIIGYAHGHVVANIIADFIPYLFLLYYFPARELVGDDKSRRDIFNLITASVVACAIITIFTSLMFGFSLFHLQDPYYHWFRDVLGGKITDTGANFFRVILNEQLLLIPIVLYFIKRVKDNYEFVNDMVIVAAAAILSINLTRIYYLALVVGLCFAFNKILWRKWLLNSAAILLCVFGFFTGFHMLTGGLANPGWEYFGLRATSIVAPHIEDSSLSRMLLLPEILNKIKSAPIFGYGLGDTVTVWSPVYDMKITTPNFDWGYLEIMAETGIVGLMIWLALIIYLVYFLIKKSALPKPIFLPSLVGILIINLTSPALFHVFGTIFIAFTLARAFSSRSISPLQNAEPPAISKAV